MLDLESLRQRCSSGEHFDYLYFWGHQPSKDGKVTKSCLSQWYESSFTVDGTVYQTAEHWMMAGKPYSGVNPLVLELASQRHGLSSSIWATFNQWKQAGGSVKKRPDNVKPGKWGTTICFTAPVTKKKRADDGTDKEDKFWILKSYTVFNLDQVEGDFDHLRPSEPEPTKMFENFEAGDELIAATGADIRTGNRACYVPSGDYIVMPPKESFHSAPDYYETVFHEMAHWTEPEHRLNWDRKNEGYAMGELIAEISACYLAAELGIPNSQRIDKSAAYLKSWLDCLKGDSRAIFRACSQASKSCALLLDCVRTPEPVDHGPLALQEILLAGCPTVGVRTGAAFVRHGETGIVVDRLPPGAACIECEQDADALGVFINSVQHAQAMDRRLVRQFAAEQFGTTRITKQVISGVRIAT